MKQNFTITLCYFVYLGMSILLYPIKNTSNSFTAKFYFQAVQKEEVPLADDNIEILHGGLLFRY